MKTKHPLLALLPLALLVMTGQALGQFQAIAPANPNDPDDPKATPSVSLTLSPAAQPMPALKYQLLPTSGERSPGNGATYYYRALLLMRQNIPESLNKEFADKSESWLDDPLEKMPRAEMQKWIDAHSGVLRELKVATYREHCDFELRLQDLRGMETISFLLHDFQDMRQLARVLRVQSRLQIADGKLDDAFETLRMGYQLAHDTAEPPFLINALIGVAISGVMNESLRELIDAPGSPNMYWAIASLPQPLVDLRPALQFEMNLPLQMYPFLKDAETADRTPEQWQKLISEFTAGILQMTDQSPPPGPDSSWQVQLATTALVAKAYPVAKQDLVAAGFDAQRVEKMPVGQVVAIQSARSYRYSYHELFKWSFLPYAEAKPFMMKMEEKLKADGYLGVPFSGREGIPLARLLLPAISAVQSAGARSDRNFAALMNIEAIRLHAAATGKLPKSLDEIKIVPVPKNPATGQPFVYLVDGQQVTLGVPPITSPQDGRWYVLTLERAKK